MFKDERKGKWRVFQITVLLLKPSYVGHSSALWPSSKRHKDSFNQHFARKPCAASSIVLVTLLHVQWRRINMYPPLLKYFASSAAQSLDLSEVRYGKANTSELLSLNFLRSSSLYYWVLKQKAMPVIPF